MKAKKLTTAEKIRREMKANPTMSIGDIAKKFNTRYQNVWTIKKNMSPKKATKKAIGKSAPVVGVGDEYEQKDGKWRVVAVATSDTPIKADNVNHPAHYKTGGIETIDFIEAKQLSYHLGNAVKYISRADHKGNRLEDLQKARWYLDREISRIS